MQKFNGFLITSVQQQQKQRKKFKPIDIIYKPTKRIEIEPICYFSNDISKAYSSLHSEGKRGLRRAHKVFECYYFIITNFSLKKYVIQDIWKIVQESLE